jgi:hypothetical protein
MQSLRSMGGAQLSALALRVTDLVGTLVAKRAAMSPRIALIGLVTVLVGTGTFAVLRADSTPQPRPEASARGLDAVPTGGPALPPGHPSISGAGAMNGMDSMSGETSPHHAALPQATDPPSIQWKAPAAWKAVANPSAMRLATYSVAPAPGDTESADVSITRAGGTTDANIERWFGQFEETGKATRTEKNVRGLKVTIVELNGTYLGGGMMGGATSPRPGWALLGAIVEASGAPYFIKVTGPAATVHSARVPMNALLDTLTPI